MKKRMTLLPFALACLSLFWLAGCGPTRLAGGTETQNPELSACVKKLAQAAFDAADAGDAWRPAYYLQDSARFAMSRKLPKRLANRAADSTSSLISGGRPDTAIIGDSGIFIRDTVIIRTTVVRPETLLVNKSIFLADTVADTLRTAAGTGIRTSIRTRIVNDSILVKDTVVLFDTLEYYYKRVISSVQSNTKGTGPITVQTDTNWISLGNSPELSGNPNNIDGRQADALLVPSWRVAEINYSPVASTLSYRIVSPPAKDTVVVVPGPDALNIRNNQTFVSTSLFDGAILVETVRFDAIDSLLSIVRFNPSLADTVESLSVNYSVDPGSNKYSGTDDQLIGIEKSYRYRLGKILHLNLSVSPTASTSPGGSKIMYYGMITIRLAFPGNGSGEFNGTIDKTIGLYGVLNYNGNKFQVNCDHLYSTNIVEMTQ